MKKNEGKKRKKKKKTAKRKSSRLVGWFDFLLSRVVSQPSAKHVRSPARETSVNILVIPNRQVVLVARLVYFNV
jgi:hypothetical protein